MAAEKKQQTTFGGFIFGLMILGAIASLFVISPEYLERVLSAERAAVQRVLGEAEEEIWNSAYNAPSTEMEAGAAAIDKLAGPGRPIGKLAYNRSKAMWVWGNLISYRLTMLLSWMLGMMPFLVAAFIDGYYVREARKYAFFSQSPIRHKAAVRGGIAAFLVSIGSMLVPVALSPFIAPIALAGIGGAGWLWMSNLQKRL